MNESGCSSPSYRTDAQDCCRAPLRAVLPATFLPKCIAAWSQPSDLAMHSWCRSAAKCSTTCCCAICYEVVTSAFCAQMMVSAAASCPVVPRSGTQILGTATLTGRLVNQNACTQGSTASSSKFSVSAQIPAQPHAHRRFPSASPTFICVVPQRNAQRYWPSEHLAKSAAKSAAKSGTAAGRKYEFSALPLRP